MTASVLELANAESHSSGADRPLSTLVRKVPVVAFADEPLRTVAYRMAQTGFTRMPVVDRTTGLNLEGMLALTDLLRARARHLEQEQQRERVLRLQFWPWHAEACEPALGDHPSGEADAFSTPVLASPARAARRTWNRFHAWRTIWYGCRSK